MPKNLPVDTQIPSKAMRSDMLLVHVVSLYRFAKLCPLTAVAIRAMTMKAGRPMISLEDDDCILLAETSY